MSVAARPLDISAFSTDRRSRQRFPLTLAVEYRLLGKGERCGSGKTRNISSSGLLTFEVVAAPEPSVGGMLGAGLLFCGLFLLRTRQAPRLGINPAPVDVEARRTHFVSSVWP